MMRNLLIVMLITTLILGGLYLIFGQELIPDLSKDSMILIARLWTYLFIALWLAYRIIFRKVKVRSFTDDVIKGRHNW